MVEGLIRLWSLQYPATTRRSILSSHVVHGLGLGGCSVASILQLLLVDIVRLLGTRRLVPLGLGRSPRVVLVVRMIRVTVKIWLG